MSMPTKYVLLAEVTGAADAAVDTGIFDTQDCDHIGYVVRASAAITASTISVTGLLDSGGTKIAFNRGLTWTAGTADAAAGIGPGAAHAYSGAAAIAQVVPPYLRVQTTAAGAGIVVTIRVYGRRNHRGPDVSMNAD